MATSEEKRSRLLQADAAMASLQADIEQRRDSNLTMIQKTSDALHKGVDEQMGVLRQNVVDETANSLRLIKERREKLMTLASRFKQVSLKKGGLTEAQITEINKEYAELQCGAVEEIYKARCSSPDRVVSPVYKTELILPQLESVTSPRATESPPRPPTPKRPTVDPNNCSIEDINVPKGKNSSFTLTLRDSGGQVLKGYANHIKVTILAVGKGIYETVHIEELPTGSYLVAYTPKLVGTPYQVCYCVAIVMYYVVL